MQTSDPENPARLYGGPNLPDVKPPSSTFFIQLFLLPATIVFGIMLVWFIFGRIVDTNESPVELVDRVANPSRKDRWRYAEDLSRILRKESQWAKNEGLAFYIADKLKAALADTKRPDANLKEFLCGALGHFRVPGVASVLRLAAKPDQRIQGVATDELAARVVDQQLRPEVRRDDPRWKGSRPEETPQPTVEIDLSQRVRHAALRSLALIAADVPNLPDPMLGRELRDYVVAAKEPDPHVREYAAVILGLLADREAIAALEQALDDPRLTVRFNAANALASLGSSAAVAVYGEMLDSDRLAQVQEFVVKNSRGEPEVNHGMVAVVALDALRSLEKVRRAHPQVDLTALRPKLEALAAGQIPQVATAARSVLQLL